MRNFSLGEVIAEHSCLFEPTVGQARQVTIRIGRPVPDDEQQRAWACPYQLDGVGDGRVRAMLGVDAMQALLFTVHTIPSEMAVFSRDVGGRFTRFGKPDVTFVSGCRQNIDLVSDAFPPRAE